MKRTYFKNIKREILEVLKTSKIEVCAMLAWLTEKELSQELFRLAQNDIRILIIISNSEWNLLNKDYLQKIDKFSNCEIRSYGSPTPENGNFMHRKLCIVDKKVVMNGAHNWSKNATKNKEDYSINYDEEDASNCLNEFYNLWEESEKVDFNFISKNATRTTDELEKLEELGISPEQFHDSISNDDEIIVETEILNEPKIKTEIMELVPDNNNPFTPHTLISNLMNKHDQEFSYDKKLPIWGIEVFDDWIKLKFEIESYVINIAVYKKDFKEVLKNEKKLFLLYHENNSNFPVNLFNWSIPIFSLIPPIKISTLSEYEFLGDCRLKLITEINGFTFQRVEHEHGLGTLRIWANDSMGTF